ncbi:LPS export ABC transporter periplasmic protein LptC [Henriciella litoralis]|uniref:LPS export ABC transporter periplasmic protein LptC n=1 Tax=Henriciella litoralis TaxID=568102 RepID=UPI0009FED3A6|nr:LPS export ABC transporter periplasmic protein LptC [Henriciella litoralis]
MTLAQARKRSNRVSLMRLGFTAAAAISAGVMVGHLAANAVSASPGSIEKLSSDEVVTMVNPRFTGRDVAGQAFVITADTAQRRQGGGEKIDLTNPKMVIEDGTEIEAPSGLYDQDEQTLSLFEDVRLVDSKGYKFRSTSAKMFVEESRVQGIDPLSGSGPLGDVRCDNFEIVDDGDRVRCSGNVQMTIFPGGRDNEEIDADE